MQLEEVMERYIERKNEPTNANGLLDFIQQMYVYGMIPIQDYRALYKQVHDLGATKPEYYFDKEVVG